MTSPVWLLDLVAGQTWRFATRAVEWDGHAYADGLSTPGSFEEALSFSEPTEAAIPLTVHAQQVPEFDLEDVALGATGTIRYWADPDGSADPVVVLSGTVEDPEYGGLDEPLTLSVREVPWDDHGLIPDVRARVDGETWPNADPDVVGEFYPVIIGEPGASGVMGSPCLLVDTTADVVLVAGHRVIATSLDVLINGTPYTYSISETTDGLGRVVSVIDTGGVPALIAGDEIWATWAGSGGGLPSVEDATAALNGAGDLIEYLLHRSTIRADWGRVRAARLRLNGYRIDTYIQADPERRISPWGWITEHLLPVLPVSVRTGPSGLFLAIFDPASPPSTVRGRLEAGRNCTRVSPVSVIGTSDVRNDFALGYAPHADGDKGSATVRVTGDADVLAAYTGAYRSSICEASIRRYGVVSDEIPTSVVYDASTATRMLTAMAARDALPPREVVYTLDDDPELRALEPGDPVAITDLTLGWTSRTAYFWSVRVGPEREATLRIWHSPGRDFNKTT